MIVKKKLGELTSAQIVGIVIVIFSLLVILGFIFILNPSDVSAEELCHNSVILRGSSGVIRQGVDLDCRREYICITKDGSCEGLSKPDVKKVKNVNEVYEILADEMASCWWMFGEGRVDYIGKEAIKSNYCSLCDEIYFDGSLKELEGVVDGNISKDGLYDYLSNVKAPGKEITYSEYIFGTNNLDSLKQSASDQYKIEGTFGKINTGKKYFVVMGITSETSGFLWSLIGSGGGFVAGAITAFLGPVGLIGGAVVIGVSAIGGAIIGDTVSQKIANSFEPEIAAIQVQGRGVENQFTAPTVLEVDSKKFEALNCEKIVTLS